MKSFNFKLFTVLFAIALKSFASTDDFSQQIDKANNQKLSMNQRWVALLQATELARGTQVEKIKSFSTNTEWYLRNASLVALNKIDHKSALVEAKKLISDKSLVVRSAAVEIISQRMTDENKNLLLVELEKKYNFHKKSSLWIRSQILSKIAEVAAEADRQIFAQYVFDTDQSMSRISAEALQKITGEKLPAKKFVENWREYVKNRKWL